MLLISLQQNEYTTLTFMNQTTETIEQHNNKNSKNNNTTVIYKTISALEQSASDLK
ncbi:MAG: hypothetical protein KAH93_03135 [Candidatus Aenigmarchaeota archaeon]|nr:hypothetical protein [Candidatus Aenigmarchaeota archaeon]